MAKRTGPEVEYWVECWEWEETPAIWQFHSIHRTKPLALATAAERLKHMGGRWRVLEVAKWPVQVFV